METITDAQKTVLLDQIVELTGYERKYAIRLLNHDSKGAARIVRPRQPIYGSAVQEALFLAWRAIQYPCAKRLVPFLPKLIPVLERDGHLCLAEDQRRQLLTMNVRTAERLLSTQIRPTPHGFSTTKPGTLLKHQIPIRTFAQRDDHRPGFLEADLVAHCGGNVFGGYLYTLTLTDIATGWTECLPVLNRSPDAQRRASTHSIGISWDRVCRGLEANWRGSGQWWQRWHALLVGQAQREMHTDKSGASGNNSAEIGFVHFSETDPTSDWRSVEQRD